MCSSDLGYTGGRLRGNWQAGINRKPSGTTKQTDKNGGQTVGKINTIVSRAKIGTVLYLSNNLPYAESVETGSSTQAPAGMVKVSAAEFQRTVKRQAK